MQTWLDCHYRYLRQYVWRLPQQGNVAMAMGTAVHAGVEEALTGPLRPQEALRRSFEGAVAAMPTPDEDVATAASEAGVMLETWMREVLPTFRPTLVEAPFSITVNGQALTGIIDAADEDVHDLKTTAGKTINGRKSNFQPEKFDFQLALYALGYEYLTGRKPKRLLLDVVTRRGTYRQYERPNRLAELLDVIGLVRDGILSENFEPTGAKSGHCAWCPVATGCDWRVE